MSSIYDITKVQIDKYNICCSNEEIGWYIYQDSKYLKDTQYLSKSGIVYNYYEAKNNEDVFFPSFEAAKSAVIDIVGFIKEEEFQI